MTKRKEKYVMTFRGKCSTKLDREKFCPTSFAPVSSMQNKSDANFALKSFKKQGYEKSSYWYSCNDYCVFYNRSVYIYGR